MRKVFVKILFAMLPLSLACTDSGNSSVPELPVDPEGTVVHFLSPGRGNILPSDFCDAVFLNDTLGLYGENLRFAAVGECDGVGYISEIAREGWKPVGNQLREGCGYIACNIMEDGSLFAALYVDKIDSAGVVKVKSLSPIYGHYNRFAINVKHLSLPPLAGDTTVYIVHPSSYRVELSSAKVFSIQPNVSFVKIIYGDVAEGVVYRDTLRFSNGRFPTVEIPIVQSGI